MKLPTLPLLLALVATSAANNVSYHGHKAYRIAVSSNIVPLLDIINALDLEVWKGMKEGFPVANGFLDLVVPAEKVDEFKGMVEGSDLEVEVMHEDLGLSIQDEGRGAVPYIAGRALDKRDLSWWESYHPYAEHIAFIEDLVATYPENAKLVSAGKSVEGRDIVGVHIWGRDGPGKQKAVVWHGNVHAREWISSKTVEYFLHFILTNLATSNEIRKFVNRYDFHIFPIVNPDGFSYTQTNERLWRKNRQAVNSTVACLGRDINRNWPYQWNGTTGASTNPCSQTYKGEAPGDAPENVALHGYIDKLTATTGVQLYLDIHSYGQLILSPFGYNCAVYPATQSAHIKTARHAADAIRAVSGTNYTWGQSCRYLYQATGYSIDYTQAVAKSKYSYLIELRDKGTFGFVLPPAQIIPVVLETWAGVRNILKDI